MIKNNFKFLGGLVFSNKYFEVIKIVLEKIPFFSYFLSLMEFIINPKIEGASDKVLKNSLLDIVNALGLSAVIIGFFVLSNPEYIFLDIIKVFNPLYAALTCIILGIVFSVTFSLTLSLNIYLKYIKVKQDVFYKIFCQSLRFYAAICFFSSLLLIYKYAKLLSEGQFGYKSCVDIFISNSYILLMFILLFRLQIIPVYKYLEIKKIYIFVVFFSILFGLKSIEIISPYLSGNIIDRVEQCKAIKSGTLYEKWRQVEGEKEDIEELFCNNKS